MGASAPDTLLARDPSAHLAAQPRQVDDSRGLVILVAHIRGIAKMFPALGDENQEWCLNSPGTSLQSSTIRVW